MMTRRRRRTSSIIVTVSFGLAFIAWSLLLFRSPGLWALDERLVAPPLDPMSIEAQIMAAFALLTWPGLEYITLGCLAIWAFRRRLRALATALLLTVALGWASSDLIKIAITRARPADHLDIITAIGYSYPSGHMVGVVASCIAVGAIFRVIRRTPAARLRWTVAALILMALVGINRWFLGAHHIGDLIGGALLGAFVASFSLVVCGVTVPTLHIDVVEIVRERQVAASPPPAAPLKRCAVIYNPVKVFDSVVFRRRVDYELTSRGWGPPLWLETTVDDPGRAQTAQAVAERVDLVLGAGGDGTIRVICSGLADTGIPFGLIPAGTSNLLARNLGIPRDEAAALRVALDGQTKAIDLVRLTADGKSEEYFAVMAGVGVDAVIMQDTNPDLKKTVGSAAYFVSAAKNANHPPLHATIRIDQQPPIRRKAAVIVVGNVGLLPSGILLIPDAKPDDGLLDVLVASPRTLRDWTRLISQVLARRQHDDEQLDRLTGRRVEITVEPRDQYQMDGDTVGDCARLVAEIAPGALRVRMPPTPTQSSPAVESSEQVDETPDEISAAAEPEPVPSPR